VERRHVRAKDAETALVSRSVFRFLAMGSDTDGAFSVLDIELAAGDGSDEHEHPGTSETFYVVEGAVEAEIGGSSD
jgi:quercetin dioxygenase-like cupin family protein